MLFQLYSLQLVWINLKMVRTLLHKRKKKVKVTALGDNVRPGLWAMGLAKGVVMAKGKVMVMVIEIAMAVAKGVMMGKAKGKAMVMAMAMAKGAAMAMGEVMAMAMVMVMAIGAVMAKGEVKIMAMEMVMALAMAIGKVRSVSWVAKARLDSTGPSPLGFLGFGNGMHGKRELGFKENLKIHRLISLVIYKSKRNNNN